MNEKMKSSRKKSSYLNTHLKGFETFVLKLPWLKVSHVCKSTAKNTFFFSFFMGSFCFSFEFESPLLFSPLEINYIDGRCPLLHRACYSSSYILYASSERKGCGVTDPNYLKGSGLSFRIVSYEESYVAELRSIQLHKRRK